MIFNNYYLTNTEVISKKTKTKTLTDSLGKFEIMAQSGDVLTFNANGFEKNQRKVEKDNDPLAVNMILLKGDKNEEIAVAYGAVLIETK
jgi:hypothetical protein